MTVTARSKGHRGELEAIKLLQPVVIEAFKEFGLPAPSLERNLMQTARGGHDIIGLDWLALEVKRQEQESMKAWWDQCKRQALPDREPVLLYRKNRARWKVQMYGTLPGGVKIVRCPVVITIEAFMVYLKYRIIKEIEKKG